MDVNHPKSGLPHLPHNKASFQFYKLKTCISGVEKQTIYFITLHHPTIKKPGFRCLLFMPLHTLPY